jgi:putative cell wall-binding protein
MVSTDSSGRPGNADSRAVSMSERRDVLAFLTSATNLGATGGVTQAVVRQTATSITTVVSVGDRGAASDRPVTSVDLSGDGSTVVFTTDAPNLGAAVGHAQVYRRVIDGGATELVSVDGGGRSGPAVSAGEPAISRDGATIAFSGRFMAGGPSQVYARRIAFAETALVSQGGVGPSPAEAGADDPAISADGGLIAFRSTAGNLVTTPVNGSAQVYVRSLADATTSLVTTNAAGDRGADGDSAEPSFTPDGRHIAYSSSARDLAAGVVPVARQIYLTDLANRTTTLISRDYRGDPVTRDASEPSTSYSPTEIAFTSAAPEVVPGVTPPAPQVYWRNRWVLPGLERLGGLDRYAGAAAVSSRNFPSQVPVVYIASGEGFPDALAAGAAAGAQSGPVLLVAKNSVPESVMRELRRLRPAKIVIVGGASTITEDTRRALSSLAPTVTRVEGADRYSGSAALSASVFSPDPKGEGVVYLASGENFPDALAGAPAAGHSGGPVLLTTRSALPPSVAAEITRLGAASVVLLGGPSSISDSVAQQVEELPGVQYVGRREGADRYATSVETSWGVDRHPRTVYIASGESFPDALAGSAAAIHDRAPVLLTRKDALPGEIRERLEHMSAERIVVLGGSATISDAVMKELEPYLY